MAQHGTYTPIIRVTLITHTFMQVMSCKFSRPVDFEKLKTCHFANYTSKFPGAPITVPDASTFVSFFLVFSLRQLFTLHFAAVLRLFTLVLHLFCLESTVRTS